MNFNSLKNIAKQFPFVYPARLVNSVKEWIDRENAKSGVYKSVRNHSYLQLEHSEHHTHTLPDGKDGDKQKFSSNLFYQTAPGYLYNIKDCYFYKQHGLVLSRRNELFTEFTHNFNISSLRKFIIRHPFFTFSTNVKKITGTGAVLVSPQSHNYYHWLFDVLPRIKLYKSVHEQIDCYCISSAVPEKFLEILTLFGISKERILLVNNHVKLHFDNLFLASLPGSEGRTPGWAVSYLRGVLLNGTLTDPNKKKVYFKRGENAGRKVLNEAEVILLLQKEGFEIVEPDMLSIAEQAALTQAASVVVGVHSAALANILFAKEGTTVIEIFSPDYFRTDCYFTLARILKLNYHYMAGAKPQNAAWGNIIVDLNELKDLLPND
ncbi:glycosyltransferase family 61 protein [Mucilaginibacter terrenus]|uniref:Glycosyltransferase family 61 protein n=1 Tax=Mucilaginibacter terrenus TaxID=2482727 RepID=A0A3E2NMK9_9SPHI|nr:glycosyltransferase family 61 protein [Mucilaginibacter terrenus]RFZ82237.1 glycosyltransferase family 61 protein [Mucilaginibacter terrenus]